MHSTGSIVIDRPIGEVFKLTNERDPEWSIVVVEEERDEPTPEVVGSTFRTVTVDHGRKMRFHSNSKKTVTVLARGSIAMTDRNASLAATKHMKMC